MPIIAFGSQKGGVGKSTTCCNFAAELAQRGQDVLIVDADRQSTSHQWSIYREGEDVPQIHCVQKYDHIRKTLFDLNDRYGFVLVDTAGYDSVETRNAISACDIFLVPFRPSQPDLDTIPNVQDIIEQMRPVNPNIKAGAYLAMSPTNPKITEKRDAIDYMQDAESFRLCKTIIGDRKCYRDAMGLGLGVVEMGSNKGKAEIQLLLDEVLTW